MKAFPPPDAHYLNAARGWCELRDYASAKEELEKITPPLRNRLEALEVRWLIHMNQDKPETALNVAETMKILDPRKPLGWIYGGSSLRALNRLEEAYHCLAEGEKLFPRDYAFPYDLACLCCLLGRLEEGKEWLGRAVELGGKEIMTRVHEDEDLEVIFNGKRQPTPAG